MADDELLTMFKEFYRKVNAFVETEYRRGERDAIDRIVQAAQGTTASDASSSNGAGRDTRKERAPKGTARSLIDRVLNERGPRGASPSEIMEAAAGVEKLASFSGVRFALDQGREENRYRNKDGKWFRAIPRVRPNDTTNLPENDSR